MLTFKASISGKSIFIVFFLSCIAAFFLSGISGCSRENKSVPLYINELLASNGRNIPDDHGQRNDWVEIYNSSDQPINMAGMYFTDRLSNPTKWQIPSDNPKKTTIQPHGYFLFWFDKEPEQGPIHADIKLSKKGESLYMIASDGLTLIDSINFPEQKVDVSYGRITDGNDDWSYFENPSPLKSNSTQNILIARAPDPLFSIEEGFYTGTILLELAAPEQAKIYYTTDGSEPVAEVSKLYNGPIEIDKNTIVRAVAAKSGYLNSKIKTRSFFINEHSAIPVVSLVCDPALLFDEEQGIYSNFNEDWEVPAHIEYFLSDSSEKSAFSSNAGISISGFVTRAYVKKSFTVKFGKKWGKKQIKYPLFKDKPQVESFKGFTLRADISSGRNVRQFVAGERIKNELIYQVNKEMGSSVDIQAYIPVNLFLNGEYWGIYNLMERKGKDFIEQNHGYTDIDMITTTDLVLNEGDKQNYLRLKKFIETKNLTIPENYAWVESQMDILNFIDYWIYETYTSARDIEMNIRFWRPRTADGKWHWISYDMDYWKQWDHETLEIFLGDEDEVNFLPELLKNQDFRNLFLNRFCDYLNTTLSPENVSRLVDEITLVTRPEVQRERERWGSEVTYCEIGSQVEWMKDYANKRPEYLLVHMAKTLGLDPTLVTIKIDATEGGTIKINTILLPSLPWEGKYYKAVPVTLEAIPDDGYRFESWGDSRYGSRPVLSIKPQNGMTIKAVFISAGK